MDDLKTWQLVFMVFLYFASYLLVKKVIVKTINIQRSKKK